MNMDSQKAQGPIKPLQCQYKVSCEWYIYAVQLFSIIEHCSMHFPKAHKLSYIDSCLTMAGMQDLQDHRLAKTMCFS